MHQSITLLGRLGNDPELRYTPSGKPVANLSLAVDKGFGENKKAIWFRVSVWDSQAESCAKYLAKGSTVLIVGELEEPRTYQGKDGQMHASLEVTARQVKFISGKADTIHGDVTIADSAEMAF